jgi:hypothetical protein
VVVVVVVGSTQLCGHTNFVLGLKLGCDNEYNQRQEGFLRRQTPTSIIRLKGEGCRVLCGGFRIKSEEWMVYDFEL